MPDHICQKSKNDEMDFSYYDVSQSLNFSENVPQLMN